MTEKEKLTQELVYILEDFDTNKSANMFFYIEKIYEVAEKHFNENLEKEKKDAIKSFLIKNLNNLK